MTQTSVYTSIFEHLKTLIDYPSPESYQRIPDACQRLKHEFPFAVDPLNQYLIQTMSRSAEALEEDYIQVFDFNPDCALEIGWHLYGENYGRGDFLVKMRDLLKHCHIAEATELPDHLTYILQALGRLEEHQAREFARYYVLPGLKKLMPAIEKKETLYGIPLTLIQQVLEQYYASPGEPSHEQSA